MIDIDVYADIACPWCYIGEQRLEQAIALRPNLKVARCWQPFQLQPGLGGGQDWRAFADSKFGSWERALESFEVVRQAAADTGINFDLEGIASAANTRDAHRLILFAREQGKEWEMARALFSAFFTQGRDLNARGELVRIAGEVGLDREAVSAMLSGEDYKVEVEASQQRAYSLGVRGVPFYVLNGKYGISGAQPLPLFLEALDQLAAELDDDAASQPG